MTTERQFPILATPGAPSSIPWRLLDDGWAQRNHRQSLEGLAQRGGLSASEALANLERRPLDRVSNDQSATKLVQLVKDDQITELLNCMARLPRATPGPGGCGTIHTFELSAGQVWVNDMLLKKYGR